MQGVLQAAAPGKPFASVGGGEPPHSAACESLAYGIAKYCSYEKRAHVRALPKWGLSMQGVLLAIASGKPCAGVGDGKPPHSTRGRSKAFDSAARASAAIVSEAIASEALTSEASSG
jgi:hypothetical protein